MSIVGYDSRRFIYTKNSMDQITITGMNNALSGSSFSHLYDTILLYNNR